MHERHAEPAADGPSERRLATRERLLDAAIDVFAEVGVQGASVEAICARAGFSRGAFYSNFSQKEELFLALLEREFERRRNDLAARAATSAPRVRERAAELDATEAGALIAEFFMPTADATAWFILETEFLLLALRDPALAPRYHEFTQRFVREITELVVSVLGTAGLRFNIPAERAVPVLAAEYERAVRASALAGPDTPDGLDGLGERLAELLFAITESSGKPDSPDRRGDRADTQATDYLS